MMLVMVLFWVAVLVLVVLGIRWLLRQQRGGTGTERAESSEALRILERRYAAGEIDREELEERRRALSDT